MTRYARIATPLGTLIAVAEDEALVTLEFEGGKHEVEVRSDWREDPRATPLRATVTQVAEYFAGARREFDLPLAPAGTDFQKRVWREIARIPFGKTLSYAELARRAGAPDSARAAGAATGRNPLAIVVPCHRVVGSDGSLTGYAGGIDRKVRLLELEGALAGALV